MKHLKSFKVFESYDDLEFLNESKLYIMPTFIKALNSAPLEFLEIVNDLKGLYGEETGIDITFVDIEDDTLTYSTMRNIEKEFPQLYKKTIFPSDLSSWSQDLLESPTRGNIKIGKFINKVLKGKYPEALVDKFVTYIKSKSLRKENWTISLVKGDEIAKYYISTNYAVVKGTLGKSCMNDWHLKSIFDLYTKNPESCSLLIMTNDDGKLGARALVWNAKVTFCRDYKGDVCELDNIQFLDRVYTTEDWMVHRMLKWAKDNGMANRYYNGIGDRDLIEYNGVKYSVEMEVNVKKIHYAAFPYLDTFNRYDVKRGKLFNYTPNNFSGFGLQSTHGNYGTTTGTSPRIRNYIRRFS